MTPAEVAGEVPDVLPGTQERQKQETPQAQGIAGFLLLR
jgi:hypothetical protein